MTATSTVSAILRSNQAYYAQLSDTMTLQWGIAFTSTRYPAVPSANQFREVVVERAEDFEVAFDAVQDYFSEVGVKCFAWAPAADQPVEPLEAMLPGRGFRRHDLRAMVLRDVKELSVPQGIRVLPARAMRKALHTINVEEFHSSDAAEQELHAAAAADRLNEAQMDVFVAMLDGMPAGRCALYQVGDIARIVDLFVVESCRHKGVALALMNHVIKMARRLTMRITCAEVAHDNSSALALCERCGMVADGATVEFVSSDVECMSA